MFALNGQAERCRLANADGGYRELIGWLRGIG